MSGDHNKYQKPEGCAECGKQSSNGWALYCVKCSEPVREWQGLTDADIAQTMHGSVEGSNMLPYQFARAIEAKLKEKNL